MAVTGHEHTSFTFPVFNGREHNNFTFSVLNSSSPGREQISFTSAFI